jgi:hypothetical protein
MDPATASIITTLAPALLSSIFAPGQSGPTQAQIQAALERQRREEAQRNAWLIGGALVGLGILGFVLVARK